jgi:hypothetical protein
MEKKGKYLKHPFLNTGVRDRDGRGQSPKNTIEIAKEAT